MKRLVVTLLALGLVDLTQTIAWMFFTGIAGVSKREFHDAPEANEAAPRVAC